MDQDERDLVRREIEGWLEEGAIDQETGDRLRDRYRGPGPEAERASDQLMGLGGHLLGSGLLMLIAALQPGSIHHVAMIQVLVALLLVMAGIRQVRQEGGTEAVGRALVVAGVVVAMTAAHTLAWIGVLTPMQVAALLGMGLWLLAMVTGSRVTMFYSQLYLGYLVVFLVDRWHGGDRIGPFLLGLVLLGAIDLVAARLVKDSSDPRQRRTSNIQQAAGVWYVLTGLYVLARTGWDGHGVGLERVLASIAVVGFSTFLLWVGIDRGRTLLRITGFVFLFLEILSLIQELQGQPLRQALLVLGLGVLLLVLGRAQQARRRPARDDS